VNRTAVVIGGGGGVGRGVCLGLANVGVRVVVADIDLEAAEEVVDEISRRNLIGAKFEVDSTNFDSLSRLVNFVEKEFDGVGILVNTTGVILERSMETISVSEWQWLWQNNVMSQISSVNAFLPLLKKNQPAHIVLTGSGAGLIAPPASMKLGGYAVTKHALTGYAKALKNELAADGIGVTLLCPTRIAGNLVANSARHYESTLGPPSIPVGGRPPSQRTLVDASKLGPLVVAAISENQFLVSNESTEQFQNGIHEP
jgi:NAD(P)-dependent dehydrogenase (short-subunit alcohol dehydrogenase family)